MSLATEGRRDLGPRYSQTVIISFVFVAVAAVSLLFADVSITTLDPWSELERMLWGVLTPDFLALETIGTAMLQTIAFALVGVALAAVAGFVLAQFFHIGLVRRACAIARAIHELFWALIFLQMLGLSPLTGVLAIAIPYAGICAKVYAETLEEAPSAALKALPGGVSTIATFFYVRLPDAWVHIKNYTFYRFECGLRSSAVLGFVGLPTLGYYLETDFSEGNYSEAAALLIIFYVMIATLRLWVKPKLLGIYLVIAPFLLSGSSEIRLDNIRRFLTEDIVPAPLRNADLLDAQTWASVGDWLAMLLTDQALPGIVATVVLTQVALVGTAFLTLAFFPLISEKFFGRIGRTFGHVFLVVTRSTPEFILVYIFLQLWGPSMLPAIVALALHNGAIIGHLLGRYSDEIYLRPDSSFGINRYAYEILPRLYGQFLAFLFYRWEVIMRETAILGVLGIATLGFYIDSAIADIRLDRAMFLILITALLNIGIDSLSRAIRGRLRLSTRVTSCRN
ncbi:MAG: ABC transporter permease [Gammaproteobacteria bacterium]|nr:ABC transporter permease [Gammaproteobacteria bacterium]